MYHVSTDNAFPYRVCSGQQDSGSGCVDSRSPDGDDHVPRLASGEHPGVRNRRAGSEGSGHGLRKRAHERLALQSEDFADDCGRSGHERERTERRELQSQRAHDADQLVAARSEYAVLRLECRWKTTNGGKSWTRISPDLARQTWEVPANTGKYASTRQASAARNDHRVVAFAEEHEVIWAGTDDGNIQVTMDGGAKWTNVTPAAIKPWTRIFNIEAGHFDANTAYAAANTMRVDDMNPHFWRTHDGGRRGRRSTPASRPAPSTNSIREDPRVKGLLYSSTDTQVWVSFDDGDHWQSLRINMPAISVRDLS